MTQDAAPDAAEHVRRTLRALGFPDAVRRFSAPVPTAAAAAEQLGCPVAAIANSLVFRAGDDVVLVLASGAHRVDPGRIAAHLGLGRRKVRPAGAALVLEMTGQHVGGVAPVGHHFALTTLVDRDLADHDVVWAGAGDDHSMFATHVDDLVAMTGGTLLEVAAAPPALPARGDPSGAWSDGFLPSRSGAQSRGGR